MNHFYRYISTLAVFGFLVFSPAGQMLAQEKTDFRSALYREAIQDIIRDNDRFQNYSDVYAALDKIKQKRLNPLTGFRGDTIITNPVIAFVDFNEVSVTFKYIPTGQLVNDTVTIDIPGDVNWLSNPAVDKTDSTLTLTVQANEDFEPRTATFTVKGEFGVGNFVSCEATVLQGAAPQPFIFVSPKYLAVSPEGGVTDPFSVTHFNVEAWEADITETWITVESQTNETISFDVLPNDSGQERDATIYIQDTEDNTIRDSLTIFQYVDTSAYIIATPSSGFLGSAATTFVVEVNANTPWEVVYTDVPEGMITDSIISQNADSVRFVISENTETASRSATVSLTGTENPDISTQIEIVQSGSSPPYIIVTPRTSNVGPEAGSITLSVDANLAWEYVSVENPGNMLTEVPGGQDAITFNISANTSISSRTATGIIKAAGETAPADTFYIVQDAAYLLLNPKEKLVPCEGELFVTDITRYNVDSIVADTSGFLWDVIFFENDSLQIDVSANENPYPVSDTLIVRSFANPAIRDTLIVFQYACNQPWIVVTPKFRALPYQGGISDTFNINFSNIPDWEVYFESPVPWITETLTGENHVRFVADANTSNQSRAASFQVRSVTNPSIFDTAVIFQDGAPDPVLIASPREQLIPHTGSDSLDFLITWQNIENWAVVDTILPEWIVIDSAGGNLLSLDILENPTTSSRENQVIVYATNDITVRDTVTIYQYSAFQQYILTAPRESIVDAAGIDSTGFSVTTANVDTWLVDTLTFPDWITLNHKNDSSFSISVDPIQGFVSLSATIKIYDSVNSNIFDTVQIYQYLDDEPVILVSPREQIAFQTGGPTDPFLVQTAGFSSWSVTSKPEWIQVVEQGESVLLLNVDPNPALETRIGAIYVGNPEISQVFDSVKIYQFSAFDSYLLANPREKSFGQSGIESTIFEITKVNVLNWETDQGNLPGWIEINDEGGDILDLKILENTTFETRHDSVFIFSDDNNGAVDTVLIYQYAANDTLLLASPRQRVSFFAGETLDFEITVQNAEAWKVDPGSVPGWIDVMSQGGNLLSLATQQNLSSSTRFSTISIFDTLNPQVNDSITVFQYSAPESYILIAPRQDTVQFFGDAFIAFDVTAVNLTGEVSIDGNSVPGWISAALNDSQLQMNVDPNPLSETRQALIYLFDSGNNEIKDSISIYQYARPEKYIMAAPREKKTGFMGGNLFYEVTAVNVENWLVDETTVPAWISGIETTPASLSLEISENLSMATRIASIRIYDADDQAVEDSVQVYQFSGLDHYLLAEPRERITGNLADTLTFDITAVNLEPDTVWQWNVLQGDSMLEVLNSGGDSLTVAIFSNPDSATRRATIRIFSESHPSAADTIQIYQYSEFEPYIILKQTHLLDISHQGDTVPVVVYSNLDTAFVNKSNSSNWYNFMNDDGLVLRKDTLVFENYTDTVFLVVENNASGYLARSAFFTIFASDPGSGPEVDFYFQQLINPVLTSNNISGSIYLEGDTTQPFSDTVRFYIGTDTLNLELTSNGFYSWDVPYGWVGGIRPEKENYFFEPPSWVIKDNLISDTTINFSVYLIDPKIEFDIEGQMIAICPGEQIDTSSANYPVRTESGTFGDRSYAWFSIPDDPNLITDTTSTQPAIQVFMPETTTNYYLVLFNNQTSDTTFFTVEVNPQPEARDFDGPLDVCRNQSGVIYSVSDFEPGEYFQWELTQNGELVRNFSSNIATINWTAAPGEYELTLYTFNNFGCNNSHAKTITVSNEEAPPQSTVSKKSGDNMLVCSTTNPEDFNFEWGWYEVINGNLGEKYVIPDRSNWYCRLPANHTYDPVRYNYFVQLSYKTGSACKTTSFLNDNAPVNIAEVATQPFSLFPNPTSGAIWLKFNERIDREITILIRDVNGQIVASEVMNPEFNADAIRIESTKRLRQGVYLIQVQLAEGIYNTKIVRQ